jgi:uncharacterized protein YdhG (YjbR/CyaY superfamily)
MANDKIIIAGGVDEYIEKYPKEVQVRLKEIRAAIEEVSSGAIQTVSYFQIPGYSYPGYDYNGMFTWFSFKEPHVRLHVRPPVIKNHQKELKNFATTDSIISFPENDKLPVELIKQLVMDSIQVMKKKKAVTLKG